MRCLLSGGGGEGRQASWCLSHTSSDATSYAILHAAVSQLGGFPATWHPTLCMVVAGLCCLLHFSSLLLGVSKELLDLVSPGIPILGLPDPAGSQTSSSQVLPHIVCPALGFCCEEHKSNNGKLPSIAQPAHLPEDAAGTPGSRLRV